MEKTLVFGKENLNGKLERKVFNEKDLTTDWLEEFLFDNNVAKHPDFEELIGYAKMFEGLGSAIKATWHHKGNWVQYDFFENNWIDDDDITMFTFALTEFFKENELTVILKCQGEDETHTYKPFVRLEFYDRVDE